MSSIPASLPRTMTAIAITAPGGPDVLAPEERPLPVAQAGEILIKVAAAGINRPDVLQRMGLYPAPKGASDLPGLEVAGWIADIGPGVEGRSIGEAVTALVAGGGYAEYVKVDARHALPVPAGLSMAEAAALPETFFTVWSNVFDRVGLKAGERFLVHGGTSGIGTTAIQLAKAFGAEVFTTVGSEPKAEACRALGADHAINYNTHDFVDEIARLTGGEGVHVILDMVGGDYVEKNWQAAAVEGRICQIANLNGPAEQVNFNRLMIKRLVHTGSTLRPRDGAFKAAIAAALVEKVWPLIASGRIKPVMDSTFPLRQANEAHRRMESSGHIGKIVLTVD
ncbi:zinc-binding dehydrogenase [Microvirga tunisiensis]|uniref:Zinc-binding dehydrogenase n=2 Tax=Pannonibacter tanglangensis TaxID=2750084 RepID=A0A7X5F582_9HYPH|nr:MULTISPECIES: NAD(P)H-quinone oxidoreductase [unclassified Pannonibacter]NBN65264.1 zinc-binding dehydrogenase [Pannonibacter sp. XCT-34]NBN79759.1 zinc-binding dehydrogenase [Pannonibacter sp. XCT-53]